MTTGPATLGTRVSEAFYVFISKSAAYQNGAAMAMRRYLRTGDPAVLAEVLPGSLVLAGPAATRDSVLAALPAHPVAHFACHAVAPLRDEADGARLVVSGDADQPLSVAAISRLDLPGAGLAYLSACDTAAQDMSDEATPITSAFQLAGYGSVIGSLWPVNDLIALRVAADVYGELTGGGTGEPAAAAAAAALHHAIRRLRADFPGHPVLWSGHVHTGT